MNYLESTNTSVKTFDTNLFNKFEAFADVKEVTLKGYMVGISNFAKWLNDNAITQPAREDVKNYKSYLDTQNFSAGTKAYYLRSVKLFFKFCANEELYPNIAENIKGVKVNATNTKKESFNEEDIKTILNNLDRTTQAGKRDYAMILLCVIGGLRTIELQRADIQDIATIKGQKVLYIQGKGRNEKDEYIKLIPALDEAIEDYLSTRDNLRPNTPLFTGTSNRSNERLHIKSISRIIKGALVNGGYDSNRLTAHSLRHTSATLLFKSGAGLYEVQKHQRHQNPTTTEIYLHAYEREANTDEQDIYNQIFKEEVNVKQDTEQALKGLNDENLKKVYEFIANLNKPVMA